MTEKKTRKAKANPPEAPRPAKRVEVIVALMKEHGISELSIHGDDLTIKLFPYITRQEIPGQEIDPAAILKAFSSPETPAQYDEVLNWSAGGSGRTDKSGEPIQPPMTGQDMPFANGEAI